MLRSTTQPGRDFYRETRCRDFMHRFISSDMGGTLSTGVAVAADESGLNDGRGGASGGGGGGDGVAINSARINALD